MTDSFAVYTSELHAHAEHVSDIHRAAATAVDAAHQVTPGGWDNAYGVICQFFPAAIHPLADLGGQVIQQMSDALRSMEGELNNAAATYDNVEQNAAQRHQKILQELDRAPQQTIRGEIK